MKKLLDNPIILFCFGLILGPTGLMILDFIFVSKQQNAVK